MDCRSIILAGFVLNGAIAFGASPPQAGVFERVGSDGWRSSGGTPNIIVVPEGFLLGRGEGIKRFRWHSSMRLENLLAEGTTLRSGLVLNAADGAARELRRTLSLRASSVDGRLAVRYYFGPRGLELDVEVAPGGAVPRLRLESLDGDLSISSDGGLAIEGFALGLRPVAYSTTTEGERQPVDARYSLASPRLVELDTGNFDASLPLVIDPVVTYASYFGGSRDDAPVAIRETADGTLLILGNTTSPDLPQGVSLNTLLMQPAEEMPFETRCFLARLATAEGRVISVSYLQDAYCSALDLDSEGRVLIVGGSTNRQSGGSENSEHRLAKYLNEPFLARLNADGTQLEYSTYLRVDASGPLLKAGAGEKAYLAFHCSGFADCADADVAGGFEESPARILLMRYDLAARRFDGKTYIPEAGLARGLERSPSGSVYIFGNSAGPGFPLKHSIQPAPPPDFGAGFVAALSPDLRELQMGALVGGFGGHSTVEAVVANSDGSIWISGNAPENAIPGLAPAAPFVLAGRPTPFAIRVVPGEGRWRQAWWAGGAYPDITQDSVKLSDGRHCMLLESGNVRPRPGGAVIGGRASSLWLGCLNEAASDFETLTPVGERDASVVAPAAGGGVWSLSTGDRGSAAEAIPGEFRGGALQPDLLRTASVVGDDLVVRHIDLSTHKPILARPVPLALPALRGRRTEALVRMRGSNFAVGMALELDGMLIPVEAKSPFEAFIEYRVSSSGPAWSARDLRPGEFQGRLLIPGSGDAGASVLFPVTVRRLAPWPQPFRVTQEPRVLDLLGPVYSDSEVRWNGSSIALEEKPTGGFQVRIPSEVLRPGAAEVSLFNPPPGGGLQRQPVAVVGDRIRQQTFPFDGTIAAAGRHLAVDPIAKVAYLLDTPSRGSWTLSSHRLPDGEQTSVVAVDRAGAVSALDLAASFDGQYLYLVDDHFRAIRFQTDPLAEEFQFIVPRDGGDKPRFVRNSRLRTLAPVADQPRSVVIFTRAGRMVIYDDDRPRPYSTSDFPARFAARTQPILADTHSVWARDLPRSSLDPVSPCVIRYPVDALGFAPPEEFCDRARDWHKYPEMRRYLDLDALEHGRQLHNVDDAFGISTLNAAMRLELRTFLAGFNPSSQTAIYQIIFHDLETGRRIGHFPSFGAIDGFPAFISLVGEEALVFLKLRGGSPAGLRIVRDWRSQVEWYR